jgi:hypothetical protein
MLDIFQTTVRANWREAPIRKPRLTWLFQVGKYCGPYPCQMRALPHLAEEMTAMADRPQLTTGAGDRVIDSQTAVRPIQSAA